MQSRLQSASSAEEEARLQNQIDNLAARTVRVQLLTLTSTLILTLTPNPNPNPNP